MATNHTSDIPLNFLLVDPITLEPSSISPSNTAKRRRLYEMDYTDPSIPKPEYKRIKKARKSKSYHDSVKKKMEILQDQVQEKDTIIAEKEQIIQQQQSVIQTCVQLFQEKFGFLLFQLEDDHLVAIPTNNSSNNIITPLLPGDGIDDSEVK